MQSKGQCINCILAGIERAARLATKDEQTIKKVIRATLQYLRGIDLTNSPADLSTPAYQLVKKLTGVVDSYEKIKQQQNQGALILYPYMKELLGNSQEPLHLAAKLAIIGNIVDCTIKQDHNIEEELREGLKLKFAVDDFGQFKQDLERAGTLLYFCDNAGEIVFDKVFIEEIKNSFPDIEVYACVKGSPVLNDATLEDARQVELDRVASVVTTGLDYIGVPLDKIPESLNRLIEKSQVIISKGQGNFETLDGLDKNIYWLLRAKCEVIAQALGVNLFDIVFKKK